MKGRESKEEKEKERKRERESEAEMQASTIRSGILRFVSTMDRCFSLFTWMARLLATKYRKNIVKAFFSMNLTFSFSPFQGPHKCKGPSSMYCRTFSPFKRRPLVTMAFYVESNGCQKKSSICIVQTKPNRAVH